MSEVESRLIRKKSSEKRLQSLSMVIIAIIILPVMILPFSVPITSDIVVVMQKDDAVTTTTNIIKENVPGIMIMEYESLDYFLTIQRVLGRIIWVSHGSSQGIATEGGLLTWNSFASLVEMTPGKDVVLACDSSSLDEFIESDEEVMTFDGLLEGRIWAYAISTLLLATKQIPNEENVAHIAERTVTIANRIISGKEAPMFLGTVPLWWIGIKAVLVGILTGLYFTSAEASIPEAVASTSSPILVVAIVSTVLTFVAGYVFYILQQWFPSVSGFLAILSPVVNVLVGLAIQKVINGAFPGSAYLLGLLVGRLAALVSCSVSWAQPWIRAAAAASAAILTVSVLDFAIVTAYTFLT